MAQDSEKCVTPIKPRPHWRGNAEIARTDIARPSKLWGLTSRDWTTRDLLSGAALSGHAMSVLAISVVPLAPNLIIAGKGDYSEMSPLIVAVYATIVALPGDCARVASVDEALLSPLVGPPIYFAVNFTFVFLR